MSETGNDINKAITLLKAGELVAIPTETVYGLAANALNEDAVIKIYEAKNRPRFNPLIVHTSSIERISEYVTHITESAKKLASQFMPGPLTLLLPKKNSIPDLVTAGSHLVAIRIPAHPMALALLNKLDFPLAAPSANPFGYISPTKAEHVQIQMRDKVNYILDGGECMIGIESTIVGFDEQENPVIFRQGAVTAEQIGSVTNKKVLINSSEEKILAPGMLSSHYAPGVPLVLGNIEELIRSENKKNIAVLSFKNKFRNCSVNLVLSETGNLNEAAKNLFSSLRILDESGMDIIFAEEVPDEGIGKAINDRLHRASVKKN